MVCRYLENQGASRQCVACDPQRAPTRGELEAFCTSGEHPRCDFYRFQRATGRPLRVEDFLAWQRRRAGIEPSLTDEPAAHE